VYAPALVGWGGSHGHNVSWFPLGPREVYVPGRRFSRNYWERVNFSNTYVSRARFSEAVANRVSDTVYRNRVVPGGVTAMPVSAFTSAGRTGDHRARFNQQELARSVANAAPPQIAPVRESRLGGPSRPNVRIPPASLASRQVVVRRDPPPATTQFTRRPAAGREATLVQTQRPARPAVRGQVNERPERNNQDRPPRVERPVKESPPPPASSVYEPRAIADRVRVDRDRQVRERQQREDSQQREAVNRQSWQRQEDQARQQQQQQQQQQERERPQRAQEAMRQAAERQAEHRQQSQQRQQSEQSQQSEQRQRNEQPRVERQQVERPQPTRSEAQKPAETRSPPRERHEGNERARRN
jgi:flagellar biosynthesis GTPase FlhF